MQVCGFNSFGQIERIVSNKTNEEPVSKCNFVLVTHPSEVALIAFAWNHIVIVDREGIVWLSGFVEGGANKLLQLENLPCSGVDIIQVATSREKLFCVTIDGQLWEYHIPPRKWRNLKNLLPLSEEEGLEIKVAKVVCGYSFVAVLLNDGRAYLLPNEPLEVPQESGNVVDMECGHEHGILLTSAGHVLTWGTALRGQLGNDTVDASSQPVEVQALSGIKCVAIAAGGWQSCALSADGDVYTWGWNKFGQLGVPRPLDDLESGVSVAYVPHVVDWPQTDHPPVVAISCGSNHMIAMLADGELWGCGWNKYGQLGLGDVEVAHTMTKIPIQSEFRVKSFKCGSWNAAVFLDVEVTVR